MITYERVEAELEARLSEAGVEHCRRVADTAAALALIYGVDTEKARLAGFLHDWDRERADEELLGEARECGIDVLAADEKRPYLLHARTGAAGVQEAFPDLDAETARAVELHTLGAVEMGELDKVVWIADMIEPARRFKGVDALRECVGTVSLDDLFAAGYEHSLRHLLDGRKTIHPTAIAVYNAHVARGER